MGIPSDKRDYSRVFDYRDTIELYLINLSKELKHSFINHP